MARPCQNAILTAMKYGYLRQALFLCVTGLLCMGMTSCWYVRQAGFFIAERSQAIPVSHMLADPATPSDIQDFLLRVGEIRRFSHEQLGLSETGSFTSYVSTEKDYIAMVISACADDSFKRYEWWYPVLGSMPYRGFYVREDADFIHARLRRQGYDVLLRKVDAFSSLGFFKDPLYSFMINYEEGELADLLIHESAHATLFIKNENQFNEEFATFVGRVGAELYLLDQYGADSKEMAELHKRRRDSQIFSGFLRESARLLEEVYARKDLDRAAKLEAKGQILAARKAEFKEQTINELRDGAFAYFDMSLVNNAYLDLYRLYEEDLSLYQEYLEVVSRGDLKTFVVNVSALTGKSKKKNSDIKKAMTEAITHSRL